MKGIKEIIESKYNNEQSQYYIVYTDKTKEACSTCTKEVKDFLEKATIIKTNKTRYRTRNTYRIQKDLKYIVSIKIRTEARNSIDGKPHTKLNYYSGTTDTDVGTIVNWGLRKQAYIFTSQRQATIIANRYNGKVVAF